MEINFKKNKSGVSTARIDDLEIQLSFDKKWKHYVADIFIYDRILELPCDYGECPEKLECEDCNFCTEDEKLCPFGEIDEQVSESNSFACYTFDEVRTTISKMFQNNFDGIAHKKIWPKNAASQFLNRHWAVDLK